MFNWIKSYMPTRLYYRAALILVLPVVFLQLIVSIVFIQRHFEGVTVQMTRTVAAELDLITEVIERDGAVAAQQIARSLGMSMSIVAQDTKFLERRRIYDLTGLVVRRKKLGLRTDGRFPAAEQHLDRQAVLLALAPSRCDRRGRNGLLLAG